MPTFRLLYPLLGLLAVACINLPDIDDRPPEVPSADGGDGGTPTDGGSDGGPRPGPTDGGVDQTAPAVIRTSPPTGATRVALDSTVEVDFSEEMTPGTLRLTSSPPVVFTLSSWAPELRRAVFTASAPLEQERQYTLSAEGTYLAGNALLTAHLFTFTTLGPTPDTTRPTMVSFSPAHNSKGNPRNMTIKLTFSEPMDKASVARDLILSAGLQGGTLSWNAAGTEATYAPSADLPYGYGGGWSLSSGPTDLAGNLLDQGYNANFQIIQWVVYSLSPDPTGTALVSTTAPTQQNPWPIGDTSSDLPYQGFANFRFDSIINHTGCNTQSAVRSVVLSWPYSDPGIGPFNSLGRFLVDPVDYGQFASNNNTLYATPSIGPPLALRYQDFNVQSGRANIPVTEMVLSRWTSQYVQFRLKFEYTTDNDQVSDRLLIDKANLKLMITCEHP